MVVMAIRLHGDGGVQAMVVMVGGDGDGEWRWWRRSQLVVCI